MSCIQKLSIQGIRSFSPDDEQRQVITFFTPLTLILGPNGTGKTSIIECLRYITTGDMPPNASKGGSFVHDPKCAKESEVFAQVKLQFKDVRAADVVVTRCLQASQKQKNVSVKTLDGVISRLGKDGQKRNISTRCADLNKEMITALGVSKAILNNVIFCHQEDSNWPLSEGKALKQKFDEIFAATRYIKALEKIRQIRIDKAIEIKMCALDVKHFRENKDIAAEKKKKLEDTETKVLAARDSIRNMDNKIKPLEDKLDEIASKETKINRIYTQMVQKESRLKEMQESQQSLRSKIKAVFSGTTDELKETIQDFKLQIQRKESESMQVERDIGTKQRKHQKFSSEVSDLTLEYGKLKSEAEQHNSRIRKRDEKLVAACVEFNLDDASRMQTQNLSGTQITTVLSLLEDHSNSIADESKHVKAKHEERENEIQSKLDSLRDSKTKLEQSVRLKSEQMVKNKNELRQIEQDLRRVGASSVRLNQLGTELLRAEADLQNFEGSLDISVVRTDIDKHKEERSQSAIQIRQLDSELQQMNAQSKTRTELELLRKEKTSKADTVKKILSRIDEPLLQLLGHIPSENIKYEVDEKSRVVTDQVKKMGEKLKNLTIELGSAESKRTLFMEQLKGKEEELKTCEERLFQICGSGDFDSGVDQLQKSIKDYQDEKGALVGTKFVFSKFIEKLQKKDPCCPLCHRDFDEDKDVADLVNELNTKLRLIPTQLENKEKLINENQQKFNSMLEFRPEKNKMEILCDKQIPELKQKVKQFGDQVAKLKKQITETEEELEVKQMDEGMYASIQSDVVMLDQTQSELRKLDKNIRIVGAKLSGTDFSRSIEQVTQEKNTLQHQLDRLNQDLDRKQEELASYSDQMQILRNKVNKLRNEQLELKEQLQRQQQLEEKRAELLEDVEQCKKVIQQDREQIGPLENKLAQTREEKDGVTRAKESALEDIKSKMDDVRTRIRDIQAISNDIERYIGSGKQSALTRCEHKLQEVKSLMQQQEESIRESSIRLDEIRNDLAEQNIKERELGDNLALREKESSMQEIKEQLVVLKEEMGGFDCNTLTAEKRKLEQSREGFKKEKNQLEGRKRELDTNVRELQKELDSDPFKDVERKFKEKFIQHKTQELACDDLKKYYIALDSAIMKYHSMKMDDINKIIRELWTNTYKGKDIDYIEIRSEETETAGEKANMRRVYHYRVMMIKGSIAMEMRGRCSAGQKVLASLVIRLALAETFCLNCGILALDEPTTNLDRENIESLAYALVEIVRSRQDQSNFQLVVITHDEDFIQQLANSDFVDKIYKVGKNEEGKSEIRQIRLKTVM